MLRYIYSVNTIYSKVLALLLVNIYHLVMFVLGSFVQKKGACLTYTQLHFIRLFF